MTDERIATRTGRPEVPGAILHRKVSDAGPVLRGIG
jgi:hypothetical protein